MFFLIESRWLVEIGETVCESILEWNMEHLLISKYFR